MGHLAGYLRLTDPTSGRCVELINGARTLSHLKAGRASSAWNLSTSARRWAGTDGWAFDEGNYEDGSNPDPWYDPQNPATGECSGFLPDAPGAGRGFRLEPSTSSRIVGASGVVPSELFITGTVVSETKRGELAYLDWIQRVLANPCADARGWTATVFSFVPCQDELSPFLGLEGLVLPAADAQPPVPFTEVCDPAPPVLEPYTGKPPELIDSGVRHLIHVRFVGIEEIGDADYFGECDGRRFQIRFEVHHPAWFTQHVPLGTLGGVGAFDDCETMNAPFRICPGSVPSDFDCGPNDAFDRRRRAPARKSRWVRPRCFMRTSFLTAPQPISASTQLCAEIINGFSTVHNVSLKVWTAIDGIPDPACGQGNSVYSQIEPAWETNIPVMGPGERIMLDGRDATVTLFCADGQSRKGVGIVEGPRGTPWRPSPLSCDYRYWVALDMSASDASKGDLDVSAVLQTFREEIPG